MKIQIEKFKKIESASVELEPLNIFIGANNSGKSSFIQGIQFAVSSCQTLKMQGANWTKYGNKTLALDSTEYLYAPTSDISYLFHGKRLAGSRRKEDRNWIEFKITDGDEAEVKISKGKNGGFTTTLKGKVLGDRLSDIESPYCVYVPGIAGIPVKEKYEVPIAVKKSATRGDSNNYLRNILYTISNDEVKWASFTESVNGIYGDVDVSVVFDEHVSEFVYVYVKTDDHRLPLDSVGTGLLQIIQIFAYIEYFAPKIILLDEPDSHIHPTKQKLLSAELVNRAEKDPDLKVIFSTHSRYILEALENDAKVFHFRNGTASPGIKGSNILLDIGAADADYLFAKKNLKYIIVTEDKVDGVIQKRELLKKFLLANGLAEDEFVLHSYEGCSKVEFARILQGFVQKQIPTAKVIVHLDRDQKIDSDREILRLMKSFEKNEVIFFLTKYQEIESYFCLPRHISNIYGMALVDAIDIYSNFISDLEEKTKAKLSNFILREREELSRNKDGRQDIAVINKQVDEWYNEYTNELTLGKELLGMIKQYAQVKLKKDPNLILNSSDALKSDEFIALLA